MTDWDRITSQIDQAISALDEAHQAGRALRAKTTPENLDVFQKQMRTLSEHLKHFQYIMDHQDEVFGDDIADALSELWSGGVAPYHKTPHDEE